LDGYLSPVAKLRAGSGRTQSGLSATDQFPLTVVTKEGLLANNQLPDPVSSAIKAFLPKPLAMTELLVRINQLV
ncbi:hypothetical protein, partial [Trichocoleus sp. FACHB-262]|uniref:hypothetical protein n=1 Tax=Trichocoleus sp. FACHB-262 TaxID=2692869 RepID=UPI001A7EE6D2